MTNKGNKTKVLFVCIGNMIRSQMAEGFARHLGSAFVEAYSAGVRHTGVVSEEAVLVMAEKGIDIKEHHSKGLSDVPLAEMDYIVNMSGYPNEAVFPPGLRATVVAWQVGDPLGGGVERFRRARDFIESQVEGFLREIWGNPSKRAGANP